MYAYLKPTDQVCNKNVFSKFAKYATMHRIQKNHCCIQKHICDKYDK